MAYNNSRSDHSRTDYSHSDSSRTYHSEHYTPFYERYRPFHHPFTIPTPVPNAKTAPQADQFPIFFDRKPPNRLEALVLGGAAQKSKRHNESSEAQPDEGKNGKEQRFPQRRSALSLKLLSSPLPLGKSMDFNDPSAPPRQTLGNRIGYFITKYVVEWWLLELVSWVVSAMCMTTIISVLWYFDGRELPQLPLGITLNSFISIFSNIARASLLIPTAQALGQLKWNWFRKESKTMLDFEIMDSASRGPWGAILLLLRNRGRSLASLGAAVIILVLPLELFFQQVVLYPSVWINVDASPTVARTTSYSLSNPFVYMNGVEGLTQDEFFYSIVSPFFWSAPLVPQAEYTCPTTNCTWDPFDTLAVCSSCSENVDQLLAFGCYESKADWFNEVTLSFNTSSYPNITACGYWLNATSDSRILMTGYALDPESGLPGDALEMRMFPLVDSFTRLPYYGGSINFQNIVNPLLDFLIVGNPDNGGSVYANATPVAYECVLSWCTQTMVSSFWWGHISENVTQTFQNTTHTNYPWLTKLDSTGKPEYAYVNNITITPPELNSPNGRNEGQNLTFGTSYIDAEVTIFTLDVLAPSFLTHGNATDSPMFKFDNINRPQSRVMTTNPWLPPNNVSEHIQNLATAMTIAIRNTQSSNGSFETVTGWAWDQKNHVHIRWAWIALPLTLLTAGLVFLLATVIRSSKESNEVGIWKTSALAILFNGLGEDVQRSVGPGCRMGEARAKARELTVKLLPD